MNKRFNQQQISKFLMRRDIGLNYEPMKFSLLLKLNCLFPSKKACQYFNPSLSILIVFVGASQILNKRLRKTNVPALNNLSQ